MRKIVQLSTVTVFGALCFAVSAAGAPSSGAPAAPPPTITIGEISSEVLQAMGMPLQMIDLEKKKTYVYKNMKIVFLNDKVSDVQ